MCVCRPADSVRSAVKVIVIHPVGVGSKCTSSGEQQVLTTAELSLLSCCFVFVSLRQGFG